MKRCALCGRIGEDELFEFHHFFPGKKRRKSEEGITVCHMCGDQIHTMISNPELRVFYHTTERLKERLYSYIKFIQNKPITKHYSTAKKKRK